MTSSKIEKVRAALEAFIHGSAVKHPQILENGKQALSELDGMVLVPVEPTYEMCESGGDMIRDGEVTLEGNLRLSAHGWGAWHVYKYMIAPYVKGD